MAWLMILSLPLYALISYGMKKMPDSGYAKEAFEDALSIPSSEVHDLHVDTIVGATLFRFYYRDNDFAESLVSRWSLKVATPREMHLRGMDQWQPDLAKFEFYENETRASVWIDPDTRHCFVRWGEVW
jgi:hypothetical protein